MLRGDGSEDFYRSRVFLGADGSPLTFQVSRALLHAQAVHSDTTVHPLLYVTKTSTGLLRASKGRHMGRVCDICLNFRHDTQGWQWLSHRCVPIQEMMDATLASGAFLGNVEFTGAEGSNRGKVLDCSATRQALQWQPKYSSFQSFMEAGAKDWYTESGLFDFGQAHA